MAKTIKFNLFLDGNHVRDIEGLQEYFNINDILEIYKEDILQKWLKVRGFTKYLEKVDKIKDEDDVIVQLIKIFDVSKSQKEIMEAVYSLSFWDERKVELGEWEKKNNKIKDIITGYHNGYHALKAQIVENNTDMPYLKSVAKEIKNKYYGLFKLDFLHFFFTFKDSSPMMVYAILMNESLREILLKIGRIKKTLYSEFTLSTKPKQKEIVENLGAIFGTLGKAIDENRNIELKNESDKKELSEDELPIKMFSGETDGYWKDIVIESTPKTHLSQNVNLIFS